MIDDKKEGIIHARISAGKERTVVHLENLMVAVWDFTDGPMKNPEPPHSHPHEQITYVAEGELFFHKGEKVFQLSKGDLITISPGVQHCIQTLTTYVRLVDSFQPVRKDFLNQK
jgi:quercetin dioxygenase-like cupin family protein